MHHSLCTNLIAYLEDHLGAEERQAFIEHLGQCADCLQALGAHRHMDELLQRAAREGPTAPGDLVDRIEKKLRSVSRRKMAVRAAGLAAAVILASGMVHWMFRSRPVPDQVVQTPGPPMPAPVEDRAVVHVASSSNLVAVPVKSRDPTVTIYWLFTRNSPAARGGSFSPGPTEHSRKGGL